MQKLTEKTFLSRALHCYDNPQCVTLEEFQDDLAKVSHVKKMITAYVNGKELNERLLLNHLVVLYNVFGNTATELLLYRIEQTNYGVLFPFLLLINRLPENVLTEYQVQFDQDVVQKLRQL